MTWTMLVAEGALGGSALLALWGLGRVMEQRQQELAETQARLRAMAVETEARWHYGKPKREPFRLYEERPEERPMLVEYDEDGMEPGWYGSG